MTEEQLENMKDEQGYLHWVRVPAIHDVMTMEHQPLVNVIRFCPLSERFGENCDTLNLESHSHA